MGDLESGTSTQCPGVRKELAEEFSHLKLGYRGDLKFWENPVIYEMTDLLEEPDQTSEMKMQ